MPCGVRQLRPLVLCRFILVIALIASPLVCPSSASSAVVTGLNSKSPHPRWTLLEDPVTKKKKKTKKKELKRSFSISNNRLTTSCGLDVSVSDRDVEGFGFEEIYGLVGNKWLVFITKSSGTGLRGDFGGLQSCTGEWRKVEAFHVVAIDDSVKEKYGYELAMVRKTLKKTPFVYAALSSVNNNSSSGGSNSTTKGDAQAPEVDDEWCWNYGLDHRTCAVRSAFYECSTHGDVKLQLVSWRCKKRAGTRYTKRGGDEDGYVSGFLLLRSACDWLQRCIDEMLQ